MLFLGIGPFRAFGSQGKLALKSCRWLVAGVRPHPRGICRMRLTRTAPVEHRCLLSSVPNIQSGEKAGDPSSHNFTLIYSFPAIRILRVVSRLKLVQTGTTMLLLPPVHYLYYHGQVTYSLMCYSTGIAVFAAAMLFSLSHYLRRAVGKMYLDDTKTTLKVSHLTFWGNRRDLYLPVTDVMTLGDTGDPEGEPFLCLKRYSCPDTLYFSTRFGRVMDKRGFELVFGSFS